MTDLIWLDPDQPVFPAIHSALDNPNGLLAAGGNLQVETLLSAYYQGIFPWYSEDEPPLWWSPDPRSILLPKGLHVSRSTEKLIKKNRFRFTSDQQFTQVVKLCADSRPDETWIVAEMQQAYTHLHQAGHAHSLEVWQDNKLVGGLYGVQLGGIFCGESMFHVQANTSKLAFICLARTLFAHGFQMIDCQLQNPFLESLGAVEISRHQFAGKLQRARDTQISWPTSWHLNGINSK